MKGKLSRAGKKGILSLGLVLSLWCGTSPAVDVVNENPQSACRPVELFRELNVFKDPTLFMSDLGLIYVDPTLGWKQLMRENPLLTQLKGRVQLLQLGPAREFKNFGAIAKLYEAAEP